MGFDAKPLLSGAHAAASEPGRAFFDERGPRAASNDGLDDQPVQPNAGETRLCHFTIERNDSVSVTSTQFAGGDWRWRLCDHEGAVLVEGAGYRSEAHCREAVAILKARSSRATVS